MQAAHRLADNHPASLLPPELGASQIVRDLAPHLRRTLDLIAEQCTQTTGDGDHVGAVGGRELETRLGLSRRTLRRHVATLTALGLLAVYWKGPRGRSVYAIPAATGSLADRAPQAKGVWGRQLDFGFEITQDTQRPPETLWAFLSPEHPLNVSKHARREKRAQKALKRACPDVTLADLRQPARLVDLADRLARLDLAPQGDRGRLEVFCCAERALELGDDPVLLFAYLINYGRFDLISAAQEDRARRRLSRHLYSDSV